MLNLRTSEERSVLLSEASKHVSSRVEVKTGTWGLSSEEISIPDATGLHGVNCHHTLSSM